MATQSLNAKQEELALIHNWCCIVLRFMAQKNPSHQQVFLQSKTIVEEAYSKKNVTGLRHLHSDIKQWAGGLSKSEKEELDTILAAEYKPTLSEEKRLDLERIKKIIQTGEIKTDEEYALVEGRVNSLSQHTLSKGKEDIEILNKLLSTYYTTQNHVH